MVNLRPKIVVTHPQLAFVALIAVSVFSLISAYYLQFYGGLPPCILCQYQRLPYYAVVGVALLGVLITGNSEHHRLSGILIILCTFAFLTGSGLALFHLGVDNSWWHGTTGCTGAGFEASDFETLKDAINEAPTANCGDVLWRFLGFSLAAWNLVWSTLLGVITGTFAARWVYN